MKNFVPSDAEIVPPPQNDPEQGFMHEFFVQIALVYVGFAALVGLIAAPIAGLSVLKTVPLFAGGELAFWVLIYFLFYSRTETTEAPYGII